MKSVIRKVLFILLIFFLNAKSYAQPYYFKHYQVEHGLSNNTVYFISQDSKGFIWFATKDGLNRFDGYQFKVFRMNAEENKKPLNTDYIFSILPGKDGMLWVGAERGLYKFNPQKERLEPFINSLSHVYDITLDRAGHMWFMSSNTVCRLNLKTNALKKFNPSEYFSATSICLSKKGEIWVSTDNGFLQKYNATTETFTAFDVFSHSRTPTSKRIQKIHAGNDHSIFIGTSSQGLKIFDGATYSYQDILTYNRDKTAIYIRDILQNTENEYWFATESGIFIYNTATKTFTNLKKKFTDPYSLSDNAIYALGKDAEGSIWAGTFFGGVNFYSKQNAAFIKYFPDNTSNAISGNAVREICKDQYDNLWIGTEDGGLNKINNTTKNFTWFRPTGEKASIAYTNIHGLLADGDDLWIGTFEHGIDIMDIRTGKVKKHFSAGSGAKDIKSDFAICFYRTQSGKILIGTSNGLFFFDRGKNEFERPPGIRGNIFITGIIEDHKKLIWISTNNWGAYWYDPITRMNGHIQNEPNNKNSLSNNNINDIYEDSNHNIWFATEGGGLCKLNKDRNQFTRYTTHNGLPGNFVFKVLEDNNKKLWATTSNGLVTFSPDFQNPIVFTQANGLLNNQFNYHSGYKDKEGRLYFGSVKGMISFVPEEFIKNNYEPPVYITGFQVHNTELNTQKDSTVLHQSIIFTDKITLPYNQSTVSIDFAALSYISPKMTEYKYKLEGLDKDWTHLKTNRKVYFTNLAPGKYIFKVKASTNGEWGKYEKQFVIQILPPFWATTWAYLVYIVLAILLIYFVLRSYNKRQQNKKEKEIYESKIEFFTNVAHEIKTPLTLIKGPVENLVEKQEIIPGIQEDLACLDRNTNRLINLVSQILDFRQTEIRKFSLDFSKVNVSKILYDTYMSFKIFAKKRNLHYKIILPPHEVMAFADGEALEKIFSNLIGNAVKYAGKRVTITLYLLQKGSNSFIIEFENDGFIIRREMEEKIFEPFYRIKETRDQKGTGIGLTLAKSLTELHKGSLYLKFSKKEVNTFVLILPIGHQHIVGTDDKTLRSTGITK